MEVINIFDAKNKLSKLISEIETKNTSYLICRNGKPVAEIVIGRGQASGGVRPALLSLLET